MQFKELLGQQAAIDQLQQMLKVDRLPHALLFLGPEGAGQLSLALALAQTVLCKERTPEGDACGTCSQCHKAARWIHPDLHFSFPTVGSKATSDTYLNQWREALAENPYMNAFDWLQRIGAENRQGNITKNECVNIIRKIGLKTFEGSHKILILWMPEYLGNEGNRLLKLIEEPPENTLFILVAEQAEQILNTILSRCQIIRLPALQDIAIQTALQDRYGLDAERATQIAFLAAGNFNAAIRLHTEGVNDNAGMLLDWLRQCYLGKPWVLVQWADDISELGRERQKQLLQYGLHFFRELMAFKTLGESNVRLQPNELETARNMRKVITWPRLDALVKLFSEHIYHIERNGHSRLQFLACGIRISKIFKSEEHELRRMHYTTY